MDIYIIHFELEAIRAKHSANKHISANITY